MPNSPPPPPVAGPPIRPGPPGRVRPRRRTPGIIETARRPAHLSPVPLSRSSRLWPPRPCRQTARPPPQSPPPRHSKTHPAPLHCLSFLSPPRSPSHHSHPKPRCCCTALQRLSPPRYRPRFLLPCRRGPHRRPGSVTSAARGLRRLCMLHAMCTMCKPCRPSTMCRPHNPHLLVPRDRPARPGREPPPAAARGSRASSIAIWA